jgi:hypothetical protein
MMNMVNITKKLNKKADLKTIAVLVATLAGILFLVIVIWRVVFGGGIIG